MELLAALTRIGGELAGGGAPVVLSDRAGGLVIRVGDVVVKAHPAGTDQAALLTRLRAAADPALASVLVPPLRLPGGDWAIRVEGRLVTAWPAGEPVSPDDPDLAPWEAAAVLLARLHATPASGRGLPAAGGPPRVAAAIGRLRAVAGGPAADDVERAFAALPPWVSNSTLAPTRHDVLVHGDWHFGQLVRGAGDVDGWRLIDMDDLGVGDPVWDLARPAALFAAGVLLPKAWGRFVSAYRGARGIALPPHADPWTVLDVPARSLVVQLAATGLVSAANEGRELDHDEAALVETCRRMVAGVVGSPDVS
jgi:aminoglycoside phosphotransferase (APT) family kinase protein